MEQTTKVLLDASEKMQTCVDSWFTQLIKRNIVAEQGDSASGEDVPDVERDVTETLTTASDS